jgi:tRNA-2-methylthio-N6-dimethylallyladenosine synthase
MAGRTMDVLFEKKGRQPGQAIGRSPWLQSVHVDDADHLIGRIVPVEIEHGQQNSLKGRLAQSGRTPAATSHSAGAVPQEPVHGA